MLLLGELVTLLHLKVYCFCESHFYCLCREPAGATMFFPEKASEEKQEMSQDIWLMDPVNETVKSIYGHYSIELPLRNKTSKWCWCQGCPRGEGGGLE